MGQERFLHTPLFIQNIGLPGILLIAVVVFSAVATPASAGPPKDDEPGQVMVKVKAGVDIDALAEIEARPVQLGLHLPPSRLALETGDAVSLDGEVWRAETLDGGALRQAGLRPPRLRSGVWQGQERHFYAMPWEDRYIWGVTAGLLKSLHDKLYG